MTDESTKVAMAWAPLSRGFIKKLFEQCPSAQYDEIGEVFLFGTATFRPSARMGRFRERALEALSMLNRR
jgi:hypothetical protein